MIRIRWILSISPVFFRVRLARQLFKVGAGYWMLDTRCWMMRHQYLVSSMIYWILMITGIQFSLHFRPEQ